MSATPPPVPAAVSGPDWRVARFTPAALVRVCALVSAGFEPAWSAEALRSGLAHAGARAWTAAAPAADPSGFLLASRCLDELEIQLLVVERARRRSGVARSLLAAALAEQAADGARRAWLEVRADNEAARRLYTGAGFAAVGRRARYYRDGEDALLLARDLAPATGPEACR